jgi:hypothetical protein
LPPRLADADHVLRLTFFSYVVSAGIRGVRLAQGKSITLTVRRPLPAQVDGEPWMMAVGTVTITHANQVRFRFRFSFFASFSINYIKYNK